MGCVLVDALFQRRMEREGGRVSKAGELTGEVLGTFDEWIIPRRLEKGGAGGVRAGGVRVPLMAQRELGPFQCFDVGMVVTAVLIDGAREQVGNLVDFPEQVGLGELGGVRGVEKRLPFGD